MSYNVLEIHLAKLASDQVVSFNNMDTTQLKHLKNTISKLLELDEATNDLEVTLKDGSWKIILLSTVLSFNNPSNYSNQLSKFSRYINTTFGEKSVLSFKSSDKNLTNVFDEEDLSATFGSSTATRNKRLDNVVFHPFVQIDDISINEEITFTIDDSVKKKKLRNGLSAYFESLTYLQLKDISKTNLFLCTIESQSRYSGIVGVFSNLEAKVLYASKYYEILAVYNSFEELNDSVYGSVSNQIIDFFEERYSHIIFSTPVNMDALRDLHSFLSLFINRNFNKQIHVNILTYLSFVEPSVLTSSLKSILVDYHFTNSSVE